MARPPAKAARSGGRLAIGGIAVVILGILGLAGADALVLTLPAMIVAGAALLIGMPMGSRMLGMFSPQAT